MELITLIGLGAIVGVAGGYAGIGGAPFLVAGLVLLLDYSQYLAQGSILAVMLGPMSLPGVWVMRDRARLLIPEITIGFLAYATCSNLGARLAFAVGTGWLQVSFGTLLVGLGVHALARKRTAVPPVDPTRVTLGDAGRIPFTRANVTVISALIGVVGGLFGIGAGVLMVPLFISLFDLHKDDARALSLSILLPPCSLGAIIHYQANDAVDWTTAAIIFGLYFATNAFGARLGRRHSPRLFQLGMGTLLGLLGFVLVATGIRLLV